MIFDKRTKRFTLSPVVERTLGIKPGTDVTETFLKKFNWYDPDSTLANLIFGAKTSKVRRTGGKIFKVDIIKQLKADISVSVFESTASKLPKSWTNVPWVNFDKQIVEQNFTQVFEERLSYKNPDGTWTNNILQVPQKTEAKWWEIAWNDSDTINDIADATKARTAFAVNGNHSNDATFVKQFHLWGRRNNVQTSTIHDAFFTHIADMQGGREALRKIFANSLDANSIKATLDEMRKRGFPEELYRKYLEEAVELGLIPVPGKSKINGKLMKESDILTEEEVLQEIKDDGKSDLSWYGVG